MAVKTRATSDRSPGDGADAVLDKLLASHPIEPAPDFLERAIAAARAAGRAGVQHPGVERDLDRLLASHPVDGAPEFTAMTLERLRSGETPAPLPEAPRRIPAALATAAAAAAVALALIPPAPPPGSHPGAEALSGRVGADPESDRVFALASALEGAEDLLSMEDETLEAIALFAD